MTSIKVQARLRLVRSLLPSWLTTVRGVSLCVFLYTTFSVSVSCISLAALLILFVSIYGVDNPDSKKEKLDFSKNPLKGKPRETSLSESREREVNQAIGNFVTNYDPVQCGVLEKFEPLKLASDCLFARQARVWGAQDWIADLSLEENVYRSIPMFLKFCMVCQELGLDAFLFLLPGQQFGSDVQVFGQGVRRVLQTLSDHDPAEYKCMDRPYLDKTGWVFEFNRITFFITTFAPFYPPSHSRYAHGVEDAYILFQPEISFAQHDLPPDSVKTNWDEPVTVRDRIRKAFRDAGRPFHIRDTLYFPMVHDIVKPLNEVEDPLVEWWLK